MRRQISGVCLCLCLAAAIPTHGFGQERHATELPGSPLSGPPVFDAPFSADVETTFTETRADGTRREQRTTARYYRDRAGRVRVEQTFGNQVRITVHPDPGKPMVYLLDHATRSVRREPRILAGVAVGGGNTFAWPVDVNKTRVLFRERDASTGELGTHADVVSDESLGSRRIAGVETTGRRITMVLPVARIGNDRPIEIVDERWESPELKILVYSMYSDPRTGVIEYQLTNVRRAEPPPDLFVVPPEYEVKSFTSPEPWIALFPPSWKPSQGK